MLFARCRFLFKAQWDEGTRVLNTFVSLCSWHGSRTPNAPQKYTGSRESHHMGYASSAAICNHGARCEKRKRCRKIRLSSTWATGSGLQRALGSEHLWVLGLRETRRAACRRTRRCHEDHTAGHASILVACPPGTDLACTGLTITTEGDHALQEHSSKPKHDFSDLYTCHTCLIRSGPESLRGLCW